jgi:hypothetical protein
VDATNPGLFFKVRGEENLGSKELSKFASFVKVDKS